MHSLAYKYNLDSSLDLVQVLQDIQVFVDVNFLMAHQWTVDWYQKWTVGKYYEGGLSAAKNGHFLFK